MQPMQPIDPQQILTDAQYALGQLRKAMACGTRRNAIDCTQRAIDALERIEDACRISMCPDVQEWTSEEILAREG